VRFTELYQGKNYEYVAGVGTRFGKIGRALGGLFGSGGRARIDEMYEELCENWQQGDEVIDIVGFSRGAALAVHFANKLGEQGVKLNDGSFKKPVRVRFLGVWDVVGSFGLSLDTVINFQEINLGWDIDTVHNCVDHCFHAMALDERRESFNVTRLDPENKFDNVEEVWFRGVHSDIGGGNGNEARSNIALQWMLDHARGCGLVFNDTQARRRRYSHQDPGAQISENSDVQIDPRRKVDTHDKFHPTALGLELDLEQSHKCKVLAKLKFNWSGVRLSKGHKYRFKVEAGDTWEDGGIECSPNGWESEDLPWYKEGMVQFAERFRRLPDANWFALAGALDDENDELFLIGDGNDVFTAPRSADLYLFANDISSKYDNNEGWLMVEIIRAG
jgi:uncharacterized protein (DUF2235 family)